MCPGSPKVYAYVSARQYNRKKFELFGALLISDNSKFIIPQSIEMAIILHIYTGHSVL